MFRRSLLVFLAFVKRHFEKHKMNKDIWKYDVQNDLFKLQFACGIIYVCEINAR